MKAVYTVLTGKHDYKLREDIPKNDGWDYICFTDDPEFTSKNWEIIPIQTRGLGDRKLSRAVKLLPHLYLPDAEITVYIDSSFIVPKNLSSYVAEHCLEDLTVMRHPKRDCVYDEFSIIVRIGKDKPGPIDRQRKAYEAEGLPKHNGLLAPGVMIRKGQSEEMNAFMNQWWEHVKLYSYRDIPSLSYTLWKNPIKFTALPFKKTSVRFGRGNFDG